MAQILVRDLDPKVVARLKQRAKRDGRSLQAEVKLVLEQAARTAAAAARRLAGTIRKRFKGRKVRDSADLVREDRDR